MADGGLSYPAIAASLASALTTVLGVFAIRLHNRVDALEAKATEDAKVLVTREEMKFDMETMRADRLRMHNENRDDRADDRKLLEKIYDKLDEHSELKEKVRRGEEDIRHLNERVNQLTNKDVR